MNVEYTEQTPISKIVDTDEFWIKWQNDGAINADKYWGECFNENEPYCYGRNDIYLNLYYAESRKQQTYDYFMIPPEVWEVPNKAFAKLINFR